MTTRALWDNVLVEIPDLDWLSIRSPLDAAWPVTQPFGVRSVTGIRHRGLDQGCPSDTAVRAVASGRVVYTYALGREMPGLESDGSPGGYGNTVWIDHGGGVESRYAHLRFLNVRMGDVVMAGDLVGPSDDTGISTAPHLHWEMRTGGIPFDPMGYIDEEANEMAEFTAAEKAALHEVAEAQIHGHTFYAGSPGRALLIRLMDVFRDLPLGEGEVAPEPGALRRAQQRALNGAGAAVRRWARRIT